MFYVASCVVGPGRKADEEADGKKEGRVTEGMRGCWEKGRKMEEGTWIGERKKKERNGEERLIEEE